MATTQLDRTKLLGLRILSSEAEAAGASSLDRALLAAKIGSKTETANSRHPYSRRQPA